MDNTIATDLEGEVNWKVTTATVEGTDALVDYAITAQEVVSINGQVLAAS